MAKARIRLIKRKKNTKTIVKKKRVPKRTKFLRFRSKLKKTKRYKTNNSFYKTVVTHWISSTYPVYINPQGRSYSFDLNNLVHNVDWRLNPQDLFGSTEFKTLASQYAFFKLVSYRLSYTSQAVYNQINLGLPRLYAVLDTRTYPTQRSKCFSDMAYSWQPFSTDPNPVSYSERFPQLKSAFKPLTSCWLNTAVQMNQQDAPYFVLGLGSIEDVLSGENLPIGSLRLDVSVKFCRPLTSVDRQLFSNLFVNRPKVKLDMTPKKDNVNKQNSTFNLCEII